MMRLAMLLDWTSGFCSWSLLPTIMTGTWTRTEKDTHGGWFYLLFLKGRIGFKWEIK